MNMVTRKKFSILFTVLASVMVLASTAWACTVLVDGTHGTTGTQSAAPGDSDIDGSSQVVHADEENSNCGDGTGDRGCDYSLGIINPNKYDSPTGDGSSGASASCHYETPQSAGDSQFATVADHTDVSHVVNMAGDETDLTVDGATFGEQQGNIWVDDSGDNLEPAPNPGDDDETIMCFYSSASVSGASHLNNRDDGAATATDPLAFTVL